MAPSDVIHKAIKRHGGLTDWDDEGVASEVKAIMRALKRKGFVIIKERK